MSGAQVELRIPPGARCTFCHSYQPMIRIEIQTEDDYTQAYRFFCSAMCHANWGTNQVKPSIKEDPTERVARAIYQETVGPANWDDWDTFAPDAWGRVRSMAQARAAIKVMLEKPPIKKAKGKRP